MTAVRTAAAARYLMAESLRDQRVGVPVIVFVLVAGVFWLGDHLAAPGPWPATTLTLYAIAAWIGLVVANGEEPLRRQVTTASVGGPGPVTAATAAVAVGFGVVPAIPVVLLPAVLDPAGFPPAEALAAASAHLTAVCTGCGVGLATARPVITRIGWSFVVSALVVVLSAVQPWLPPVGAAVRAVSEAPAATGTLVVDLVVAVVVLVAGAALNWAAARRG